MASISYDQATKTLTILNPMVTVMSYAPNQPFGFQELRKRFKLKRHITYQLVYGLSKPIAKFKLTKTKQIKYKLLLV